MRSLKKMLVILFAVMLVLPVLGGCAKSSGAVELEAKNTIEERTIEEIKAYSNEGIGQLMVKNTYESFVDFRAQGNTLVNPPFDNSLDVRWKAFTEQHGAVTNAVASEAEKEEGGYVSHIVLTGEDGQMMRLNVSFSEMGHPVSSTLEPYADDSNKTFGEKMAEAGMNTLVGMVVVFTVLILLSLIISAFKFVGKLERKPAPEAAPAPAAPAVQNPADDKQLVAVIAAAVAALENVSTDSFTIKSIERK